MNLTYIHVLVPFYLSYAKQPKTCPGQILKLYENCLTISPAVYMILLNTHTYRKTSCCFKIQNYHDNIFIFANNISFPIEFNFFLLLMKFKHFYFLEFVENICRQILVLCYHLCLG